MMDLGEDSTTDKCRHNSFLLEADSNLTLMPAEGEILFIEHWGEDLLNNPTNQIPGDRTLWFTGHLILQKPLIFPPVWLEFFEIG